MAATDATGAIVVFDYETEEQVAFVQGPISCGGKRLALTPDATECAAASFHRGVSAFDLPSGRARWTRDDLRRIEWLRYSADAKHLLVFTERAAIALDARSGEDSGIELPGITAAYESDDARSLLVGPERATIVAGSTRSVVAGVRKVLGACFLTERVCIAEFMGPLRCVDDRGETRWTFRQGESHIIDVAAVRGAHVAGVQVTPETGASELVVLDRGGRLRSQAPLTSYSGAAFVDDGAGIVLSDGSYLDTLSGRLIRRLDFCARVT